MTGKSGKSPTIIWFISLENYILPREMKKEFNYGKQTEGRISLSAGHFQKEKKKKNCIIMQNRNLSDYWQGEKFSICIMVF